MREATNPVAPVTRIGSPMSAMTLQPAYAIREEPDSTVCAEHTAQEKNKSLKAGATSEAVRVEDLRRELLVERHESVRAEHPASCACRPRRGRCPAS